MNKLIPFLLTTLLFVAACKNVENRDFSKNPDTVKLGYKANRDMIIILSVLPDSLITNWKWLRSERAKTYDSEREFGYTIDSTSNYQNIIQFKNDYIELKKGDVKFSMRAYQIGDGEYILLGKEETNDTTIFKGYRLLRDYAAPVELEEVIGRYKNNFYNDATNQACLDGLNLKVQDFEFDITKPNKLFIKLVNPEKKKLTDCLKGTYQTMVFDSKIGPFSLESIE